MDKKNPKELFLHQLLSITNEFEQTTGTEIYNIKFNRIENSFIGEISSTLISRIELEIK